MDLDDNVVQPSIQRRRPIDASGLFWSLISIIAGIFYGGIFSVLCYPVFGFMAVYRLIWQYKTWVSDHAITREATQWCRLYYSEYRGTPIVDFMVGLAHISDIQIDLLTPSTPLVDLIPPSERPRYQPLWDPCDLVRRALHDARIRRRDYASFEGSTLNDAIQFAAVSPR